MPRIRALLISTVCLMLLFVATACGGTANTATGSRLSASSQSTATTAPTATPLPPVVVIHTKTAKVAGTSETVLADVHGKTIYYFTADTSTQIACTASCAQLWPPLLLPSGTPASASALPGTLTTFSGTNGTQVVYNGHPLYTYSKDEDSGDVYGQGVAGKWFAATPDLKP